MWLNISHFWYEELQSYFHFITLTTLQGVLTQVNQLRFLCLHQCSGQKHLAQYLKLAALVHFGTRMNVSMHDNTTSSVF